MRLPQLYLLTFIIILYITITIYYFQTKLKTKLKGSPPPFKLLILISQPRSGSSYLSKVISKSIKSIYFYEPLYRLGQLLNTDNNFIVTQQKQLKYNTYAKEYLRNIFQCSFHEKSEWSYIYNSKFSDQSTLHGDECEHNEKQQLINSKKRQQNKGYMIDRCMPYFDPYQLERDCHRYNLMIKLLEMRLPNKNVLNIQSYINQQTSHKVIYLVRDPRAMFLSMLRLKWIVPVMNDIYRKYIGLRCDEMYNTITSLHEAKNTNFVIIRYEDLMTKPKLALKEVLTFLDKETSQKITKILNTHDCYVPRFNKRITNITDNLEKHIARMLLQKKTSDEDDEGDDEDEEDFNEDDKNDEYTQGENKEDDNLDDKDIEMIKEQQRKKYQCFTINKWRYSVTTKFVDTVEERCNNVMNIMGYKLLNGEGYLLKDIKHSLVTDYIKDTKNK